MSKKLGLIAKDDSDIKVIKEILLKLFDAGEYSTKRQGKSIQLYKSPREMNPEQLWETTMMPPYT